MDRCISSLMGSEYRKEAVASFKSCHIALHNPDDSGFVAPLGPGGQLDHLSAI